MTNSLDEIERSLRVALAVVERLRGNSSDESVAYPVIGRDREEDLITPSQAAGRCGVCDHTVRRWLREDPELGITVGGRKYLSIPRLKEAGLLKR